MRTITFVCLCLVAYVNTLAQDTTFYQNVEWSPNGKKIVTETIRRAVGGVLFDGYIMDAGTGAVEKHIANAIFPAWRPDGKLVAYSKRTGIKNASDIWTMNIATGDTVQVTNGPGSNTGASFSPDGKRICFSSNRDGNYGLYVSGIDGTGLQKISTDTFRYFNPVWSANADNIVYYRERGDNKDKVFMINLLDKKEVKVTDDTLHDIYPGWLPDGKTIIYSSTASAPGNNDVRQIALINMDGTNKRLIPGTENAFFARASPNGKQVAFIKGRWPQNDIYISGVDGSNVRCITCK